jgi:hypothetical protein
MEKAEWKLTDVEILTELNKTQKGIIQDLLKIEYLEEKLEKQKK